MTVNAQSLHLSTYDIDQGLSKGIIKGIVTDSIGYLWCATDEGLIQYDGINSIFNREMLPKGFAKGFYKRRNGGILVYHDFGIGELVIEEDSTFLKPILPSSDKQIVYYPKSIYEDNQGRLWISEIQSIIRLTENNFERYDFGSENISLSLQKGFSFAEDINENLWAISNTGLICVYDEHNNVFKKIESNISFRNVSFVVPFGSQFLIGDEEGVYRISPALNEKILQAEKIANLKETSSGVVVNNRFLFVGTENMGLYSISLPLEYLVVKKIDDLPYNSILDIYSDKNGLWVCGPDAVALLYEPVFRRLIETDASQYIHSIYEEDAKVLVTTGFNTYEIDTTNPDNYKTKEIAPPKNTSIIQAIYDDNDIVMGAFDGLVYFYNPESSKYNKISNVRTGHEITAIHKDNDGFIWVAGNDTEGLLQIQGDSLIAKYDKNGLKSSRVVKTINEHIYVAGKHTQGFLFRYDKEKKNFIDISPKLSFTTSKEFVVNDLIGAGDSLLLATNHGLLSYRFADGIARRVIANKIPIEQSIIAIATDGFENIWLATNEGLIKLDRNEAIFFDHTNGLPSRTLSQRAIHINRDNIVWVGTIKGIAIHTPKNRKMLQTPIPISRRVLANNTEVKDLSEISSFEYATSFSFNLTTLSYPSYRIMYQYRTMEDAQWSEPTLDNNLLIPSLTTGTYTIQLRSQQVGMKWSEPLTYQIAIAKPWYLKFWFMTLFFLSLIGTLIISVKIYNRNLERKNVLLESIVEERTNLLKEKQDEVVNQKNQIISQQEELILKNNEILEAERITKDLKEHQLNQEIENKTKQLATTTLKINQKNETLNDIKERLSLVISKPDAQSTYEIKKLIKEIDFTFRLENDWEEFSFIFEQVYVGFFKNLKSKYPQLNTMDLRHCALIRLNLTINETANLLRVSPGSIKTFRFRLRKKVGIDNQEDLLRRILEI